MSDLAEIEIDLGSITPREKKFRVGGALYILREPTGDQVIKYRNAVLRATKMRDGEINGVDGLADTEAYLVSLCLFQESASGVFNVQVAEATIRGWPSRFQKTLFNEAKNLGDLEEKETPETLEAKIGKMQKQREKLLKEQGRDPEEVSLKKLQGS